jgi:hypothetical protein
MSRWSARHERLAEVGCKLSSWASCIAWGFFLLAGVWKYIPPGNHMHLQIQI